MEAQNRLIPEVCAKLAQAIEEAGGNEVFASGTLDEAGFVSDIVIGARGNEDTVPVHTSNARDCSVLIHNHPSGILYPSDADLNVATWASENGQGFYIVDNSVTRLYAVVEPVKKRTLKLLDAESVSSLLSAGGPLDLLSDQFEERPSQIKLVKQICAVFNTAGIGVFEAGTGVGKSYAYLLPSMLWALENNERVIISTGTINLQQQLFEKDIPAAERILGREVKAVLMKGRQNYLCRRRLTDSLQEKDLFSEETDELSRIAAWSETSVTGSRSDMSFMPADALWTRVNSESDACMGMRCAYYQDCFIMRMRKEAADANLLVVNHHLLFADIESRISGVGYDDTAVLPPYKRVIFDEAHGMESAATSFFSEQFTRFRILKQLNTLYRQRKTAAAGHLFTLEALSSETGPVTEALSLIAAIKSRVIDVEEAALALLEREGVWRLSEATAFEADNLFASLHALRTDIAGFTGAVRQVIEGIDEKNAEAPAVWESKKVLNRLESSGTLLGYFTEWSERRETIFWMEKARTANGVYPRLYATPLDIAPTMLKGVFEPLETVVCTSATLRTGTSFSYWMQRTGTAYADEGRVFCGDFPSPFPYNKNMLLAIPSDAPLPDDRLFQSYVENTVVSLILAAGGRTLVLFTSYESLRSACDFARSGLLSSGILVLKQGDDDRFRLLETFKNDTSSVLFATDSFWEGVDVPGESLSQVIIVKLPFGVPSDPVFAARSEALERTGGNPFMELSIPEAVIRFRQGVGRLMRRGSDRGAVVVLDRRILVKRYGSIFLQSIPETVQQFAPLKEILSSIERFL